MLYKRYKMLQKYINGEAQEEYKQGELISEVTFNTLDACNEGNQNPDKPIEGYIYQWVTVSGEYVCNDVNKYTKEKEQKSSDNGVTWTDTGRTRQGTLIEANSVDCGYVPPTPGGYETQYLTFEALQNGTFTFTGRNSNSLSYSVDDGQTWTALASGVASPTVTSGNKIIWKGITTPDSGGIGIFSSTGTFNAYGNTMSIVYGDNFRNSTVINYAQFKYLFKVTKVVNAENLVLPATSLAEDCYFRMFKGCTSLTTAPAILPATTLAVSCYSGIFEDCTSLTTAPQLPATTLASWCYGYMFNGCTSLRTAPVLPATTLTTHCYALMFYRCKNLNYIKCLATDISADGCLSNWVKEVITNGTFVKNKNATWDVTGVSGIPTGWTVQVI